MSRRVGIRSIASGGGKAPAGILYAGFGGEAPAGTDRVDVTQINTETAVMTKLFISGNNHFFIGNYLNNLHILGTVSSAVTTGMVSKVSKSTLTEIATLTFAAGENSPQNGIISGNFLYAATRFDTPAKIIKINLDTFAEVSTLTLGAGEGPVIGPEALAVSGNFLYVACYTTPGKISKIDLRTFTEVGVLTLGAGEGPSVYLTIGSDGFLYVACDVVPGIVVKINLSTFMEVATLGFNPGEDTWLLHSYQGFLYVMLFGTPVQVAKIDLSTFSRIGTLTFSGGDEGPPYASTLLGQFLYVSCNPVAITKPVVKVSLATFTEVSRFNLDTEHSGNTICFLGSA